ncbi:TetR/AcrR family transcriptional regulator [Aestuariibacter halophilus]|uniref:TetR/AcrR family transcriptional regulator n=1 Tax=Fluctibacter halophilus TaxID=226011 RepID=A0ABS8GAG9_9ALTE|nr:TetR/AcrR family transcriptional regulator [Aestuariibacter halophilus]MCC2617403.1 TetR/AcrR family transcriptional regulator [Aestuariibacter halophilus]
MLSNVRVGRPKSVAKRRDILFAASELYLQHGYSNTSMDQVANRAGVSKQTVYSHFANKDALFTAAIRAKCEEYQLDSEHLQAHCDDVPAALRQIAHQFVRLLLDPSVIAMHRVLIGEVNNAAHAAKLFYEAGPKQAMEVVATFLARHVEGVKDQREGEHWASVFFNLLKSDFHMCSILGLPFDLPPSRQNLLVEESVESLLVLIRHRQNNG